MAKGGIFPEINTVSWLEIANTKEAWMFEEVIITDWKEILELEIDFPSEVFRGQSDARWEISSSLSRAVKGSYLDDDYPINTEFWLLRDFKRGARNYLVDIPHDEDIIGWLSIMQHYGAPTRLIDFSNSFYIACYFALIDAKNDAAVWAIDPSFLVDIGNRVFQTKPTGLRDEYYDTIYSKGNDYLNDILSTASNASNASEDPLLNGVIPVEPNHVNKRLSAQQGLFLLPLDITESFSNNMSGFKKKSYQKCKKIIIKKEVRETALAHLKAMNITSETLFPGIEGFTRSLIHKQMCL